MGSELNELQESTVQLLQAYFSGALGRKALPLHQERKEERQGQASSSGKWAMLMWVQ